MEVCEDGWRKRRSGWILAKRNSGCPNLTSIDPWMKEFSKKYLVPTRGTEARWICKHGVPWWDHPSYGLFYALAHDFIGLLFHNAHIPKFITEPTANPLSERKTSTRQRPAEWVILVEYADDLVMAFPDQPDTRQVFGVIGLRLRRFELTFSLETSGFILDNKSFRAHG
jgi:hypothetical protein